MPLSYCSIACAIQPMVRPTINSPSPAPRGSPSPAAAAARAKSTFGCRPLRRRPAARRRLDRRVGVGDGALERREDGHGARIARRIEELAKSGEPLVARQTSRHQRHRVALSGKLKKERFRARGFTAMAPPGQRAQRGLDDGVWGRAGRGDAARDKGRGIELVIGDQHEAAPHDLGAALIQAPGRGEPAMDRLAG